MTYPETTEQTNQFTEQRSVVTVHVSPYLVYMKQVSAGPNNN